MIDFQWISAFYPLMQPLNLSLELYFSFVSLWFFSLGDESHFSFACALLLQLKIRVNGSVGHVSSRLGNSRLKVSQVKSSLSMLQDCYSDECYNNGYCNCIVPNLFQFFCNQVLSLFFQAYCSSIPSLKFELSVTYNYAYDLSIQIILNQIKLIKNKLRQIFMQNITKMQ